MDVGPSLIANLQPPISVQPRMGPLHDPSIATQSLRTVDAPSGNSRTNPSPAQRLPLGCRIVGFVRMQLLRSLARPTLGASDGLYSIDGGFHHLDVMDMGSRERHRQRDSVSVDHKMALRARFAAILRIRPGRFAPPGAGTVAESMQARDQSILSASPSRSRSTLWSFFQTPACCQALSRRQHVIPLPQPISRGSISQGMPVFRTKRIPVSTFRSGRGGRPPFGFGLGGGRSGWMTAHSSSETSSLAILPSPPRLLSYLTDRGFVRRS